MTNRFSKKPKQGSTAKARRNHTASPHVRAKANLERGKRFKGREA